MNYKVLIVVVMTICLFASACTATRPVSLNPPPTASDADDLTGRQVVIYESGGRLQYATVVSVDERGITVRASSGSRQRYVAFADMQSLGVREPSTSRTSFAVLGSVAVVALGYLLYLAAYANVGSD
jgi:hypothetical protein